MLAGVCQLGVFVPNPAYMAVWTQPHTASPIRKAVRALQVILLILTIPNRSFLHCPGSELVAQSDYYDDDTPGWIIAGGLLLVIAVLEDLFKRVNVLPAGTSPTGVGLIRGDVLDPVTHAI